MRSLGLDVGDKRTGVAISDPKGILATPLSVLASEDEDALIDEVLKLVGQYKVEQIVVGLPRRLNGSMGKQANKIATFADKLSSRARQSHSREVNVRLWDERLSTKAAQHLRAEAGHQKGKAHSRSKKRKQESSVSTKAQIDAMAAAFILQGFLDSQRLTTSEET